MKFKSDENPEDRGKRLHSVVTAYLKGQESDIPASLKGIILDNVVKGFIHVYPSYRGVYGIYDLLLMNPQGKSVIFEFKASILTMEALVTEYQT